MRRLVSTIIILSAFVGILIAQETDIRRIDTPDNAVEQLREARQAATHDTLRPAEPVRRKVDIMADEVRPYNTEEDSIVYFLGNFAAHHNGAVISCDSAVRYGDASIGFFGRVIINQDSIYIYGDSALYDGVSNVAEIYAPIVKVVDGDALLYTYNFSFNTADKIGRYSNGGVLVQDNDIMESQRGYYYADSHDIICVEDVEMHGADYDMKSDSAIYNTETKFARFFTNSEIWNADGDYLSADEGHYDQSQNLYMVTRNGYILSEEQEMWGDSIAYYRTNGHIIAHGNIQMDDFKNKVMAFGDYAEYWSEPGNAILTRNPATISYDLSQSDSVFMRADSMLLFTIDRYAEKEAPSESEKSEAEPQDSPKTEQFTPTAPTTLDKAANEVSKSDASKIADRVTERTAKKAVELPTVKTAEQAINPAIENIANAKLNTASAKENTPTPTSVTPNQATEKVEKHAPQDSIAQDNLAQEDNTTQDSVLVDTVKYTPKQLKAKAKEAARKEKEAARQEKAAKQKVIDSLRKIKLDSIAAIRQAKITAMLKQMSIRELERAARDSVRRAEKRAKLAAKGRDVSELDKLDSLSTLEANRLRQDTTKLAAILNEDSIAKQRSEIAQQVKDNMRQESEGELSGSASDSLQLDSIYRLVKAYRNVRMYRSDAQMICDSMVSNSTDSIIHLYIEPVMWNNANQIASKQVDVFTRNQQIERAEFLEEPIMISEIDTTYYNQITGKSMIALFRNNEIYQNDVTGNVQTIFFNTESEKSKVVTEMVYLESATASFYIEDKQLVGVTYRNDIPFKFYPIKQVPENQEKRLPGFKWVPEKRPTRENIFDRTIRPTMREERRLRERPRFSIIEKMDRHKEQLIRDGVWYDREDELSPEIIEWRNSREL